jgi:anhydro-N-acetylmuramic acid kinase
MKNIISKKISEFKTAAGIMSGTSLDGIDVLITRIKGAGVKTRFVNAAFKVFAIPPGLKAKMRGIMHSKCASLEDICRINYEISALYAACVKKLCASSGLKISDLDFIGISGQTFYHIPGAATLQLGSGAYMSALLNKPVVWDFRAADIAAGGQGAPLVPYLDYILFAGAGHEVITLNIGGISNLTHIPPGARFDEIKAFDCGPGNMIIDKMIMHISGGRLKYDKNAKAALGGKISPPLFKLMKSHPYLKKTPPKSTGREVFGDSYTAALIEYCKSNGISFSDMIRTATEFSVYCVINDIKNHIINKKTPAAGCERGPKKTAVECETAPVNLICSGGGSQNPLIFDLLDKGLAPFGIKTIKSRQMNVESKSKEALLIAVLANETVYGRASNVPSATGAKKSVVCGSVAYQQ